MYFTRKIDGSLEKWMEDADHKPLLIRGARQTGKTTAVRHLARRFKSYIELNFDEDDQLKFIFDGSYDIPAICAQIETRTGQRIVPGQTLLFLDEIQACPRAISALRYFYEKCQPLHVIATGSLLEFAFSEIADFGVGRIRNLFVHPFSFAEFADATGNGIALEQARSSDLTKPVACLVHEQLLDCLKSFLVVGGMPAAVRKYVKTRSYVAAQEEQDDILVSLKADFGKYKKRIPPERVRAAFHSVIDQIGEKFVYTDARLGLDYRHARECTDLLELARLVMRVSSCHANGVPLGADVSPKGNKFLVLDTGLYLRESGLDLSRWILDPAGKFVNRGKLAELFVGLELKKGGSPFSDAPLYYWHREERGSNAEVDYLVQHENSVLPIEVKSGVSGSMKSLRLLMKEKELGLGIRASEENLGRLDSIRIVPLYLIGELSRVLRQTGSDCSF